jgi:hypothetical protein
MFEFETFDEILQDLMYEDEEEDKKKKRLREIMMENKISFIQVGSTKREKLSSNHFQIVNTQVWTSNIKF